MGSDCISSLSLLIFLLCGKTFTALPFHMVRNAYWLTSRKQLGDMSVLY